MDVLLGDGIFNVDGELWRKQRKTASFEFASKNHCVQRVLAESVRDTEPSIQGRQSCGHAARGLNASSYWVHDGASHLSAHLSAVRGKCTWHIHSPLPFCDVISNFFSWYRVHQALIFYPFNP